MQFRSYPVVKEWLQETLDTMRGRLPQPIEDAPEQNIPDDDYATGQLLYVPEVVQTSNMDCGPATLKAVLEGFGVSAHYGRLREACQTDVDGTSIDTLEDVANLLGLEAEQIMLPLDHLLNPEADALPAIVIIRQPNGLTHFVVVWRTHENVVQIMDPSTGRRWPTVDQFLNEVYIHEQPVPAELWREWAGTEAFCAPLRARMAAMDLNHTQCHQLLQLGLADPSWHGMAHLDAAIRMVQALVDAGGIDAGREAFLLVEALFARAANQPDESTEDAPTQFNSVFSFSTAIPANYYSVFPHAQVDDAGNEEEETVIMQGAVLLSIDGYESPLVSHMDDQKPDEQKPDDQKPDDQNTDDQNTDDQIEDENEDFDAPDEEASQLSPELIASLEEPPSNLARELWNLLKRDGLLTPMILVASVGLATLAVTVEALLLRGLLEIGTSLGTVGERLSAAGLLILFTGILLMLEFPISATLLRMGRRLEIDLRAAFLRKLPRLSDRYFHSRLTSDMVERAHAMRAIRTLPIIGINFIRLVFQLVFTTIGVMWLHNDIGSIFIAILAVTFAVGFTLVTQPVLVEQDLRLRTHTGALSRFYLDALLGLIPIRTHGAEQAVRREHEGLLVEWVNAGLRFGRTDTLLHGIEALSGIIFAILILFSYISGGGEASGVLLLFYWTLSLPVLGQHMADMAQQYPLQRNLLLRLMEPLSAPEEEGEGDEIGIQSIFGDEHHSSLQPDTQGEMMQVNAGLQSEAQAGMPKQQKDAGIYIAMNDVTVVAGGHTILEEVSLEIQPGEHVAIVGPSGAGKSTLAGLLLGWHRPALGDILVDDTVLDGAQIPALRREIAWVDPSVQLWNRTLIENLHYGAENGEAPVSFALEQADLFGVVEKLPQRLQTKLGEGGGLVSGGEGQRVRLGRAVLRPDVRLAILDEPFRGLDRIQRQTLLARMRTYWDNRTLIFISHDVADTQDFDRVIVMESGHIVEDDNPTTLAQDETSRYHTLLTAEQRVHEQFWGSPEWRRLQIEEGELSPA
ncbi:MAG: ATP-binding cassette domain-containing protein [Chloroflexota bacterium]